MIIKVLKTFYTIFFLFCYLNNFAKADSVYVEIIGDTVKIWDKQIYENCCAIFIHEINISNDSITVIEKDTSTNYCHCMCYFDLCASLIHINAGFYRVFVYRTYAFGGHDSMYFIDSTSFIYEGTSVIKPQIISFQSNCFSPTSIEEKEKIPNNFTLLQNYPNPFNPTTIINYQLPTESWVILKVYNVLGQEVATLVNGKKETGRYEVEFKVGELSSGVYLYKIVAQPIDRQINLYKDVKKMIILK